jgi:hypothetical protein
VKCFGNHLTRQETLTQHQKMKLIVTWKAWAFHLLNALPKGTTLAADFDRDDILNVLISSACKSVGGNRFFMWAMQRLTWLKHAERVVPISHHPT